MTSGATKREQDTSVRLGRLLGPAIDAVGCELEQVGVSPAGKRKVVRVMVDSDNGVTLDEIAAVSRAVAEVLDAHEDELLGATPYVLEVSSPGVDRPLNRPRQWQRSVGRLVEISGGTAELRARVTAADDDGVELTEETGARRTVPYGELGVGHVQVEFSRPGAADEDDNDAVDALPEAEDDADGEDDDTVDAQALTDNGEKPEGEEES